MNPGLYTIDQPVFIFDAGDEFELMSDTYDIEVCDACGNKTKCDWLEYQGHGKTGMDMCRSCEKKYLKSVEKAIA